MLFRNPNQTSVFGVNSFCFISVARTRVDFFQFRILNRTSHLLRWSTHELSGYTHSSEKHFGRKLNQNQKANILWLHLKIRLFFVFESSLERTARLFPLVSSLVTKLLSSISICEKHWHSKVTLAFSSVH